MIYRDLRCKDCGAEKIDVVFDSVYSDIDTKCDQCGADMTNKCTCGGFKLLYNNQKDTCAWSNDSYASSHYYDEVK